MSAAIVRQISPTLATPFIERWHYSHHVPTGKNIFFGWLNHAELYAVSNYGIGVNNNQTAFLARITGLPVTNTNLMELKRLCRIGPRNEDLPLTKFLSRCHKILKSRFRIRFIVSFSDPAHGHNGGIYKAAGFRHLGQTDAGVEFRTSDGRSIHPRTLTNYAARLHCSFADAVEYYGVERFKTVPKDRWFLDLGLIGLRKLFAALRKLLGGWLQ